VCLAKNKVLFRFPVKVSYIDTLTCDAKVYCSVSPRLLAALIGGWSADFQNPLHWCGKVVPDHSICRERNGVDKFGIDPLHKCTNHCLECPGKIGFLEIYAVSRRPHVTGRLYGPNQRSVAPPYPNRPANKCEASPIDDFVDAYHRTSYTGTPLVCFL
jgi:hypothetical protein